MFIIGEMTTAELGQSIWLRELHGRCDGASPQVDLEAELRTGNFIREAIAKGLVRAVHDVSDGGLLIAATEMCLAGNLGIRIDEDYFHSELAGTFFGESQGRYLVETEMMEALVESAQAARVAYRFFGFVADDRQITADIEIGGADALAIPLVDLRAAHEGFFPKLMGADGALA